MAFSFLNIHISFSSHIFKMLVFLFTSVQCCSVSGFAFEKVFCDVCAAMLELLLLCKLFYWPEQKLRLGWLNKGGMAKHWQKSETEVTCFRKAVFMERSG